VAPPRLFSLEPPRRLSVTESSQTGLRVASPGTPHKSRSLGGTIACRGSLSFVGMLIAGNFGRPGSLTQGAREWECRRAPYHPRRLRVCVQNGKRPGIRDRRRLIWPLHWQHLLIIEDKSATGKSARFSAGIIVGDTALILRCREQQTEAAFSTENTDLGEESVKVRYRIDLNEPIQQAWRSSINGRAAFAPKPMDFIRTLPDNGRIFLRAIASDGSNKDTNFIISGTSAIRDKIARACN
jgi:hypothetical protein